MPEIRLDVAWCKRCGICVAICPHDVFTATADGLPVIERAAACTGCLLCELQCPDFALEIVEGQ
ncbi:MAG: 4Fe-4S binding protein [Chloroflexi bacterium]|nr:4Fe-4S binding protein [Chloroflexota bacterium]